MAECSRSCVGRRGFFICVGLPLFARKHGVHNELWEGQAGCKRGPVCVWGRGWGRGYYESFMALPFPRCQGSSIPPFHPQTFSTALRSVCLPCGERLSHYYFLASSGDLEMARTRVAYAVGKCQILPTVGCVSHH